jgi:hypothetical protein
MAMQAGPSLLKSYASQRLGYPPCRDSAGPRLAFTHRRTTAYRRPTFSMRRLPMSIVTKTAAFTALAANLHRDTRTDNAHP